MNASPFAAMASQLSCTARPEPAAEVPRLQFKVGTSRTEQIRQLLRAHGSMVATAILASIDLPDDFMGNSGLVGALLKNDIAKGQVTHSDGRYHWNHDHDEALHNELQQAAQLLRRHGYTVRAPQ